MTKNKTILKSLFILFIFTLAIQVSAVWTNPPSGTPPANNIPPPVNTGIDPQMKNGAFAAQGLRAVGPLGLGLFDMQVGIGTDSPGVPHMPTQPLDVIGNIKFSGALMPNGNAGTDGFFLKSKGPNVAPEWVAGSGGGSLWIRTGTLLSPLNTNDDIGMSNSAIVYKNGQRFIHNYGTGNTFLGLNSGNVSTTGTYNTGLGVNTLQSLGSGSGGVPANNTAVGYASLFKNTSASENTAIGVNALYNNIANSPNGGGNTAVGYASSFNNTSGNLNTAVGFNALSTNTTGNDNVGIGRNADVSSAGLTNAIAIGASTTVNASNKVRIGNSLITVYETQVPWTNPSDIRLKKDIKDSDLGLDFINSLRPVSYLMKNDTNNKVSYGFIAQDVLKILDGKETNIVTQNSPDDMFTMRYNDLMAPMVKAIQEQQKQIEELKAEIEILKNK